MVGRPRPRPGAYETYWRFAAERQQIFTNRIENPFGPWTADPILASYKFCNVYRAADRVSQFMIREICYGHSETAEDLLFQIVLFRTFSKQSTWAGIVDRLGTRPRIGHLLDGTLEDTLDRMKADRQKLYTGAFILCANDAFGRRVKHRNHVELFKEMFVRRDLAPRVLGASSLKDVYYTLHDFPLMGDFMSYQIAIDINYSELTAFSENDFTQPGPGAVRGLAKVFQDLGGMSPADAIRWMVDNQEAEFARLGLDFAGLWGRPIQAIDAQNLFCETDKYLRQAMPELTSARSQIKSKFTPAASGPIDYFFPPKWGLSVEQGFTMAEKLVLA